MTKISSPSLSYPHRQQTYLRSELAREDTPGSGSRFIIR